MNTPEPAHLVTQRQLARCVRMASRSKGAATAENLERAKSLRTTAFHQAGHLWAAHLLDFYMSPAALDAVDTHCFDADSVPLFEARSMAMAGPLAAAAHPLADAVLDTFAFLEAEAFESEAAQEFISEAVGSAAPCRYAPAQLTRGSLDRYDLRAALQPMVHDWPRVHQIATLLLDGLEVSRADVAHIMKSSVARECWETYDWKAEMDATLERLRTEGPVGPDDF